MSIGALAAALGIGATLYGINKAPEETDDPAPAVAQPVLVNAELTLAGQQALAKLLGESCVKNSIAAILIGGDLAKAPWDLLVLKSPDCAVARITLTESLGTVAAG